MSPALHEFLSLDLPAMLTGTLAVVICGLLGNFLVLRRLSLMGDAISHAVLPGLVAGFLITGSRATIPMFLGAAAAGIATVVLVELVRKLGRLDSGAAMGVVFSILFALGVVLIKQAAAENVDLDPDCVLNGQLEDVFWLAVPVEGSAWSFLSPGALGALPRELITLLIVTAVVAVFIALFFKELRLAAFDPALATSLGFNAGVLHYALMLLVAAAVVASFEAVGSILVVAMLICPAATARLLTDRLASQIWVSLGVSLAAGVSGYLLAAHAPLWLGGSSSLSASGMMTVVAGVLLVAAIIGAPRYGVVARRLRTLRLAVTIAREDLLAMLYRLEEAGRPPALPLRHIRQALGDGLVMRLAARSALRRDELAREDDELRLTMRGRDAARGTIRSHRLWESYLVQVLGLRPDHVHRAAMDLEHVTDAAMSRRLAGDVRTPRDPHDRPIPPPLDQG